MLNFQMLSNVLTVLSNTSKIPFSSSVFGRLRVSETDLWKPQKIVHGYIAVFVSWENVFLGWFGWTTQFKWRLCTRSRNSIRKMSLIFYTFSWYMVEVLYTHKLTDFQTNISTLQHRSMFKCTSCVLGNFLMTWNTAAFI